MLILSMSPHSVCLLQTKNSNDSDSDNYVRTRKQLTETSEKTLIY